MYVQGAYKHRLVQHMGVSKHTGSVQMYGRAYRHHLSLTKHAFFVLGVAAVPITESHGCQRACV